MSWDGPILTDLVASSLLWLRAKRWRGKNKKKGNTGPLVKLDDDGLLFLVILMAENTA